MTERTERIIRMAICGVWILTALLCGAATWNFHKQAEAYREIGKLMEQGHWRLMEQRPQRAQ
jgi:hypothetical protein